MPGSGATLVLGGARSGKSRHAEQRVRDTGLKRIYIATAQAFDDEMAARIAHHRAQRADDGWITVEEPLALAAAIRDAARPGQAVLVDCLTLWLSNVMLSGGDIQRARDELVSAVRTCAVPLVLVSNEVGLGIVPETPLGRQFRDAQGRLNQDLAAICDNVVFIAAGLPLMLKGS